MEFVPVDAGAEGGLAHGFVIVVVVVGAGLGVLVVLFEDVGRIGFGAVHMAVPFACAAHVCLGQAAVVDEHALERGVGPSFEPVAVARHVDQAALDARAGPDSRAGFEDAFHAVAYEHVGRGELCEQGPVGGCVLPCAPLPGEHLAVLAVDRRQQAPAVHPGAVGHDRAVHHAIESDMRFEVPAPCAAPSERARSASRSPLGRRLEQPVQEGAQHGRASPCLDSGGRRCVAGVALPALPAVSVVPVLAHRSAADGAFAGPFRSCSHGHNPTAPNRRETRLFTGKPKMTFRHAYCHNGKPTA